jgi:GTP-binding protein HflX
MLFATLDPTLRAVALPHGAKVILSDTVGFISDLPTTLVAAFRATLEEVIEADVILHVRDVSHEDSEAQSHDVADVLRQLAIEPEQGSRLIEVWNKIDRLDTAERERLANLAERQPALERPVLISATTGEGMQELTAAVEQRLSESRIVLDITLESADGAGASWLHRNTEVMAKSVDQDGRLAMRVRADPANADRVRAKFGIGKSQPARRRRKGKTDEV